MQHRAAPDDRAVLLREEADRHEPDAVRLHRHHQVLDGHGAARDAHHPRDGVAVDVGVEQPHGRAAARQGDREVGRDARLAHAALARGDADDRRCAALLERRRPPGARPAEPRAHGAPLLVGHGVHRHLHPVDALETGEGVGHAALDLGLQGAARDREPDGHAHVTALHGDVAHHPEVDDAAVELRVLHLAQGRHRGVVAQRGHMNILA